MANAGSGTATTAGETIELTGDNTKVFIANDDTANDLLVQIKNLHGVSSWDRIKPGESPAYEGGRALIASFIIKSSAGSVAYRWGVLRGSNSG